jgi:hypothetical protein
MDELEQNRHDLQAAINSPGGRYLMKYIDEQITYGWEKFIALPVDKKTSKQSYDSQAKYKVLKDIKDWINSEVNMVK